jgi:hypothetical protein
MAVVGTAGRGLIIYQLENQPQEYRKFESPLKYQVILGCCPAIQTAMLIQEKLV